MSRSLSRVLCYVKMLVLGFRGIIDVRGVWTFASSVVILVIFGRISLSVVPDLFSVRRHGV